MKPANIDRVGLFFVPDGGRPKSVWKHGLTNVRFDFKGTNTFVTVNEATYGRLQDPARKRALSELSDYITDQLRGDFPHLGPGSFFLNVGIEPPAKDLPYMESAHAQTIVRALADELAQLRLDAAKEGAVLDIVVRFASEMNLLAYNVTPSEHPYDIYKEAFINVGMTLKASDPTVKMSFSPGLNYEGKHWHIAKFWPGPEHVDLIGGTFYMNGATANSTIEETLVQIKQYVNDYKGYGLPFVIDEVGSWDPIHRDNNRYTKAMIETIGAFGDEIHVPYMTLFYYNGASGLKRWNINPDPSFLNP